MSKENLTRFFQNTNQVSLSAANEIADRFKYKTIFKNQLHITYAELNNLFHSLPEFREFGRSVLVKGFSELKTRMLSMITETAEERYEALLQTKPEIFQQAPLKNIASYLGITDTSLSRIRKDLAKK